MRSSNGSGAGGSQDVNSGTNGRTAPNRPLPTPASPSTTGAGPLPTRQRSHTEGTWTIEAGTTTGYRNPVCAMPLTICRCRTRKMITTGIMLTTDIARM
jgi:hypothetical protein